MNLLPSLSSTPTHWRSLGSLFLAILVLSVGSATPAHAESDYGNLDVIYEHGGWKYETELQWIYVFGEAGEGSFWLYSHSLGWMWHGSGHGDWIFSWGFASPQWTLRDSLGFAVRREAMTVSYGSSGPNTIPLTVVDYEIVGDQLNATVVYHASGQHPIFYLYVEDELDGDNTAKAWITWYNQGDGGTQLIQHDVTFNLSSLRSRWGIGGTASFNLSLDTSTVSGIVVTNITHDSARITAESSTPGMMHVEYGQTAGNLDQTSVIRSEEGITSHVVDLVDLPVAGTVHYRVGITDDMGGTTFSDVRSFSTTAVQMATSVSQHGITWTFDKEYPVGQFVNGDWWVVGPVEVVEVDPAPGPHTDTIGDLITTNQWGDTSLRNNDAWKNGSMVVMGPSNPSGQGYDSRNQNYNANSRTLFPVSLPVNRSLISSISSTRDQYENVPNVVFHHIMWSSESRHRRVMNTAAVLTVLDEVPAGDAFRPTYMGSEKRLWHTRDLAWDRLQNLPIDARRNPLPPISNWERYFERVWLDHINGSWVGQLLWPSQNQPAYGREDARLVGGASLLLNMEFTRDEKETLLYGLVQRGIDLRGIVELGGRWNEGGGHSSGRKWPIIFSGVMLDDDHFLNMPATAVFQEDTQAYWGHGWHGQRALWQMITHHGTRQPYLHLHPSVWPSYDGTVGSSGRSGASVSESYRVCCNAIAWVGQGLAALLMDAKSEWNHDVFFEVVEDWIREEDIYVSARMGRPRASQEGGLFAQDQWVENLWRDYRHLVPEQPDTLGPYRWWNVNLSGSTKWEANERPPNLGPDGYPPAD